MILQLLINGLIIGAIYALVASGFSIIYSTCKFFNFAHGAVVSLSAYFLFFLSSLLNLNFYLAVILTIIFSGLVGLIMNYIYKQLRRRKTSSALLLLASFAILIFCESIILIFFGANVKNFEPLQFTGGINFGGAIITPLQVGIIITSIIVLILLIILMKGTKIGKAMRAVSDNKETAEIIGIDSEKIYTLSMVIGSIIAGIAGILIGLEQNLTPTMGTYLVVKSFAGVVIGGIGSILGAILGSFFLGLVENLGIWFLPSGYQDAITFIILFIFLIFRPRGLLGIKNILSK